MPTRRTVTPSQAALLTRAGEAAEARRVADKAYVDVVLAALDAGITKAEIARAIGISGEAVRKLEVRYRGA